MDVIAVGDAMSLGIALLMATVSATGLLLGSSGRYSDPTRAAAVEASTAGLLVPGFMGHDLFNLPIGVPLLLGILWVELPRQADKVVNSRSRDTRMPTGTSSTPTVARERASGTASSMGTAASLVVIVARSETVSSRTPCSIPPRVTLDQLAHVSPSLERHRNSHVPPVLLLR
jgi:hypothetical protein